MFKDPFKFLVVEGYKKASRKELVAGGMALASDLYVRMLQTIAPNSTIDIVTAADTESAIPSGVELKSYHGATMTGSNLSVCDAGNPSVRSQVELQRKIFEQGVPSFGSCWALQIGTIVAGGTVDKNPKGREMGFGRKIQLTEHGRKHPMYEGKNSVFDVFSSHEDEIVHEPENSKVLSSNSMSRVQSIEINYGKGTMWSVQYHPEYDTREMAALIRCREQILINMGFFNDSQSVHDYIRKLELLADDPERKDTAWELGIDGDILDSDQRQLEVVNWIRHQVQPRLHKI